MLARRPGFVWMHNKAYGYGMLLLRPRADCDVRRQGDRSSAD